MEVVILQSFTVYPENAPRKEYQAGWTVTAEPAEAEQWIAKGLARASAAIPPPAPAPVPPPSA
jgi:hypothetical protein